MDKFVSSLKQSRNSVELFRAGRKTKYNHLKAKLRTMVTENLASDQDELNAGKMKLGNEAQIKQNTSKELVTVVNKLSNRNVKNVCKVKKKKKNKFKTDDTQNLCHLKLEKKRRRNSRVRRKFAGAVIENKVRAGNTKDVDIVNNKMVLHDNSRENKAYVMVDKIYDDSISEQFVQDEDTSVISMNTTVSPVVVHRKRRRTVSHHIFQFCEGEPCTPDENFYEEFSSVLSCFRKGSKNSSAVYQTCEMSPASEKCASFVQAVQSSVTNVKRPQVNVHSSVTEGEKPHVDVQSADAERKERQTTDKSQSLGLHILPSNGCIMTMKHPSEIFMRGKVKVTVLKGSVEILGFTATVENSASGLSVFCPERFVCLSIVSCKSAEEGQDTSFIKKLETLQASYSKLLKECLASDCVLLLQETSSTLTQYLAVHFPFTLFPKVVSRKNRKFHNEENLLQCQFEFPFNNFDTISCMTWKAEWKEIITDMSLFANSSKTVVLGGKGVGKSTFLRYLANACVSERGAVLWLDFDPGQAEFTVPGCLSVTLVTEPLLGPNFTHHATPLRMVFLGEVDVSACPSRYNSCVEHIILYCRSQPHLQNIPWLVNTMGFNIGLGIELAIGIVRFLRPTSVIHIESKNKKNNFAQPLKSWYVSGYRCTWSNSSAAGDLDYPTRMLQSAVEFSKAPSLKPRQCRELMVLAYLSRMVSPPQYSLLSVVPYHSPLRKLALVVCHEAVDNSHVLVAMNGSLVGLGSCDTQRAWTSSDPDMAKVLAEVPVAPCLGFGIVRGVDMVEKVLYVITPLPIDALSQVNCLIMGAVNLPQCVYTSVEPGMGHVPYVTKSQEQPMDRTPRREVRRPKRNQQP